MTIAPKQRFQLKGYQWQPDFHLTLLCLPSGVSTQIAIWVRPVGVKWNRMTLDGAGESAAWGTPAKAIDKAVHAIATWGIQPNRITVEYTIRHSPR